MTWVVCQHWGSLTCWQSIKRKTVNLLPTLVKKSKVIEKIKASLANENGNKKNVIKKLVRFVEEIVVFSK